jgi:signal transduction histidine kinase/CheY-like chemotaxis protein
LAPIVLQAAVPAAAVEGPTLTDPDQVTALSIDQRSVPHTLDVVCRVAYSDPRWRNLWVETNGHMGYFMYSAHPPVLRQGQRVRIQGKIMASKGLDAADVTVSVLREFEPAGAMDAKGRICDATAFNNHIVTVEGYVDSERLIDDDHMRLALVIQDQDYDDQPAIAWIKPDNPRSLPDWQGKFIRITALYHSRFDPSKTQMSIELWSSRQDVVEIVGSIEEAHAFDAPLTPIDQLYVAPTDRDVRIRGTVQSDDPGPQLVVRDDTGQVVVHSVQQQRVRAGSEVEAVGRIVVANAQWSMRSGLFRVVVDPGRIKPKGLSQEILTRVDEIRQLSPEDAAKGRPADISGVVTWALPGDDFFFLQDITGGIRVRYVPGQMQLPQRNKYLRIEGVTYNGGFAPAVEIRRFWDLGSMDTPPVREVTFDQAITGEEDGQMVDMLGFYQWTESEGDVRRIHAVTPSGEFTGLLVSPITFDATPGSLIRLRGICEAVTDENGRIKGIVVRTPSLPEIIVEHDAPANAYDLPLRSLRALRRLSTSRELTRVHVAGTVIYSLPGRLFYIEDGSSAILVLSRETAPLSPGDRIEAVGILGSEGVREVLREASYRKLGTGPQPAAVAVADPSRLSVALDSHLVSMRGFLLGTLVEPDQTRLTLLNGGTLFEAVLDEAQGKSARAALTEGTGLELTGIYRVTYNDSRQSRGFQLRLRSVADIEVFQKARLLTQQRALEAAAVLAGCVVLGLGWVTALRRRVRRQTEQIRGQLERQVKLEGEVQHAARLESLGVLAGGIAHDFNNLLTIIMGNISLAMLDARVMEAAGESMRETAKGAAKARDLIQQLLTFAKGGSPVRSSIALTNIVRETTEFILRGSSARSEFDFQADLWNASVDKDQTAQVIQNLVLNAVQAMPASGVVRITLRNETLKAGFRAALAPGRYIRLTIADSGEGISPEVLPRIFDPYFSTKATGSGLGLATVYSIVKKHQGDIEVSSAPGHGTTFTAWLPAAEKDSSAAQASESVPSDPLSPCGTVRVLLMDDDESIRRFGATLLKRMGLEATLAKDGAEAVREFIGARSAGRPYGLLILDLTIPGGMGGKTTIEAIRKIDPSVPAIVSSGYSNDPVLSDFSSFGFQAMVSKPYDVKQLATTIRELLARRS